MLSFLEGVNTVLETMPMEPKEMVVKDKHVECWTKFVGKSTAHVIWDISPTFDAFDRLVSSPTFNL